MFGCRIQTLLITLTVGLCLFMFMEFMFMILMMFQFRSADMSIVSRRVRSSHTCNVAARSITELSSVLLLLICAAAEAAADHDTPYLVSLSWVNWAQMEYH